MIHLENLQVEKYNTTLFYIDDHFLIYKNNSDVVLEDKDHKEISRSRLPIDYIQYDIISYDDMFLIVFGKKYFRFFDKNGLKIDNYDIDQHRTGQILSNILYYDQNDILFASKGPAGISISKFNIMDRKKVIQTKSWNFDKCPCIYKHNNLIYTMLDNYILLCYDMLTGDCIWKKFETDVIHDNLFVENEYVYYVCQNYIKKIKNYEYDILKTHSILPTSIHSVYNRNLYFACNENKNMCEYNSSKSKITWQIIGTSPILKSYNFTAYGDGQEVRCLLVINKNNVSIMNLSAGEVSSSFDIKNIVDVKINKSKILLQTKHQTSFVITGDNSEKYN